MEHELLEKIAFNTEPIQKKSFQIVVSNNKTKFTTRFNPHIQFKKNRRYEIALVNLETYYSFPNITTNNNHFSYSPDSGGIWYHILIPEGSYDIEDINKVIQQKMKQNGHEPNITISANTNTLKAVLMIENGYHADFQPEHSICNVLGFNHRVYTDEYQESENPVNILSINSILVNIDIISGSYVNGQKHPTVYSFFKGFLQDIKLLKHQPTWFIFL